MPAAVPRHQIIWGRVPDRTPVARLPVIFVVVVVLIVTGVKVMVLVTDGVPTDHMCSVKSAGPSETDASAWESPSRTTTPS